jgi:hypothetical protein
LNEITLNNLSNYQRKLIFHNIKPKYANSLYFETIVVSDDEGDDKESDRESPILKSDNDDQTETKEEKTEDAGKTEKKVEQEQATSSNEKSSFASCQIIH